MRHPAEFIVDAGGGWRLRVQAESVEPETPTPAFRPLAIQRGCYIVFDLETLGREALGEATEIIEIAWARYENGRKVETWQTFVRPSVQIPPLISELTSIRDEDVADAPDQVAALEAFFERTRGYPLIAHNGIAFDGAVLRSVAQRVGVPFPSDFLLLDTLPLARLFLQQPGQRHTNEDLALHYGCHQAGAHRAAVDVEMLGGLVDGLIGETNRNPLGVLLYELLRRAGDPWADLLDPPLLQLDLEASLARLGEGQIHQLPARGPSMGPGAEDDAIDVVFDEITRRGRDRREPQIQLAHLTGEALRSHRFAVLEAGTGTGKGLGYLVPAVLHARAQGQSVVVSTQTKVLQNQLMEKDLAFLTSVLPGLTAAVLKGRTNYLSLTRLHEEITDALEEDRLSAVRAWTLGTLGSFSLTSTAGDLESVEPSIAGIEDVFDARGEAWTLVGSVRASAAPSSAPQTSGGRLDFYSLARRNADRADIVVVNHSLLLRHAVADDGRLPDLMSPFVVCDEAHNLEDAATNVLKQEVTEPQLRRVLRAIYDRSRRSGLLPAARRAGITPEDGALAASATAHAAVTTHLDSLSERLRIFAEANTVVPRKERERYGVTVEIRPSSLRGPGGPALREAATGLFGAIQALRGSVQDLVQRCGTYAGEVGGDAGRRSTRAARLGRTLVTDLSDLEAGLRWFWTFAEATTHVRVISLEPDRHGDLVWHVEGVPIDVSVLLHDALWSRLEAGVFCSATLATHGDGFGFFLRRTGVGRLDSTHVHVRTARLPDVFDYKEHALLMLPAHLPTPRDTALKREFPEAVAMELGRFIPYFRGRTLGLFTARSRMRAVHEKIAMTLHQKGYPVLCQGEGSLSKLRDEFEQREEVSLLGVRSLWEGIDIPGRSLSFVFMSKLPFPSLGDPVETARMAAVERAGGNGFYGYFLPKTIFTFKQGFGRLLRSKDDHGVVILLDRRLRGATYRPDVLQSLPGPSIGYESDLDMYRRICSWMGEPFDESLLPPFPIGDVDRVLAEHTLAKSIFTLAEFDTDALPHLRAALKAVWGFVGFRGNQLDIIRATMTGHDVLSLLPTGAGKSLTFQLPALVRPGLTIVISPLIALIRDQVQKLREEAQVSFVNCLVSGMAALDQEEALREAAGGRLRLLYVSPERLRDPRFRTYLPLLPIVQLVVDEAHCISSWGHDFRPDFLEIASLLPGIGQVPIQALTATAPPRVEREIRDTLKFGQRAFPDVRLVGAFRRPNLVFRVLRPQTAKERDALAVSIVQEIVADAERGGPGIVYVATRREAERLARLLRGRNIAAQPYHAGMALASRHHVQELFMQGELQVVVATNAFGMGVDKQEIRFVLHFDHPSSVEAYVQESGRAGRDGLEAYAILLYSRQTQRTHRFLARHNIPNSDLLDQLAKAVLTGDIEHSVKGPGGSVLCSVEDIAAELDLEEAATRVMLHALERSDVLTRGEDFALEGTILLNRAPEDIASGLEHDARLLWEYLQHALELTADVRATYQALEFASATGRHPGEVDALLYQLAQRGDVIYRGFQRGITLAAGPRAGDPRAVLAAAEAFQERLRQFNARLAEIVRYAEMREDSGRCRAEFLESYLTGANELTRCGVCDLCAPNHSVPWTAATIVDPEPLEIEPTMAILEAVRDHDGVYGALTFRKILVGERYGLRDGERYALSAYARNSEHFGALRGTVDAQKVGHHVDRLLDGRYLELVERARGADGGVFRALRLTARGRDVLAGAAPIPGNEGRTVQNLQAAL